MHTQLGEQDPQRYPRETTRSPDATGGVPRPLPLTVGDGTGGGGDNGMDLPVENVHQWMATQANPRRIQLERLLELGTTSVTQRDWYKRC